jgi:hypothetical protein
VILIGVGIELNASDLQRFVELSLDNARGCLSVGIVWQKQIIFAFGVGVTLLDALVNADGCFHGKLKTDIERDAFNYWINNASVGQFVALPEGTPEPIVEAYRAAYEQSMHTDEMKRVTTFVSGDFLYLNGTQMAATVKDLARTSQEAIQHIISMGNKQGITIE